MVTLSKAAPDLTSFPAGPPPLGIRKKAGPPSRQPETATWRRCWCGHGRYWTGQVVFWFGYGLLTCSALFSDQIPVRWRYLLLNNLVACALGLLFSHLIRLCSHLGHWNQRGWGALIAPVALFCLAYGLTCAWWADDHRPPPPPGLPSLGPFYHGAEVGAPFNLPPPFGPLHGPKYFEFLRTTIVMLAWVGLYLGYGYERQLRASQLAGVRLDASAKEAQLRALQNQLNPHFLFNSLNTIRALIEDDGQKARQVVTNLSDLLRAHLRAGDHELVPVRQELATLQAYLEIETCRYEDRLQLDVTVDPAVLGLLVPPFLLQTLVENAIKHGIATQPQGGRLSCQILAGAGELCVRVSNPGTLTSPGTAAGTGLTNARERLRLLFGEAAALELSSQPDGLVVAALRLPKVRALP